MASRKRDARVAGALYLALAVLSGLPWFFLQTQIIVAGDPAATTQNVTDNLTLMRLTAVSDVLGMTCWVLVAMVFHRLLRHVSHNAASALVVFVGVGAAVMSAAIFNHIAALTVVNNPSYPDFLVPMFLDLRTDTYAVANVFFGLWLFPLGVLAYRSGLFPRALGVLLMVGCAGYLVDMVANLLFPDVAPSISPFAVIPATVAELWMVGYLLWKGVRATHSPSSVERPMSAVPIP